MVSSYLIEGYRWRHKDYCRTELGVGLCEIQGKRDDQQDALAVCTQDLTGFTGLTPAVRAQVLEDTVAEMQAAYGGSYHCGSTLCSAIAWLDPANQIHIDSVNVGDSAAYLVLLDRNNQLLGCRRLTDLHNPDPNKNSKEYQRVCQSGFRPTFHNGAYRLKGSVMLTRGIGDREEERYGFSHLPDIKHDSSSLQQGQSAYVVLACDGLDRLSVSDIGKRIAHQARAKASTQAMALDLVSNAFSRSSDNISAAVFKIEDVPSSALVLDGHGDRGEVVANNVAKGFYPALQKNIHKVLEAQEKERIQRERQTKQIELIHQELAFVSNEEKIQRLKNKFISLVNVKGSFSELDQQLNRLSNEISTSYLDKVFSTTRKTFPTDASGQYSEASIDDLTCVYAYESLSVPDKESLIADIILSISIMSNDFEKKRERFKALATQLNDKIRSIEDHIALQPKHSERWAGIFTTKNQGAKTRLLTAIKLLRFDHSTIPTQANLCDYEKRKVELNALLNAYETKLTQNKSKRHLSSYNTFKATLDTREETPNLAESLQSHASVP